MPTTTHTSTYTASGTATAPGAGSNIVNLSAPAAGVYRATVRYAIAGTTETVLGNVRIVANGSSVGDFASAPGVYPPIVFERLQLDGVNNFQVRAVGAATAGATYQVSVSLERVS